VTLFLFKIFCMKIKEIVMEKKVRNSEGCVQKHETKKKHLKSFIHNRRLSKEHFHINLLLLY
jgi:hypothetical protein